MAKLDDVYNFVYRAQLTEEALDVAGRSTRRAPEYDHVKIAEQLSIDELDERHLASARAMAIVYAAIAAFENAVRELISKTLLENAGEKWWEERVSEKIREQAKRRMDEEAKVKWHGQRGQDPIYYTMLPNLMNIIRSNQADFTPFVHDFEWAASIFDIVERSRNVIMHSGVLDSRDIARLGTFIRDWTTQVAS